MDTFSTLDNDTLAQILLLCCSDPFPLFLVCKRWNDIQRNDRFWMMLSIRRWPSLSRLSSSFDIGSLIVGKKQKRKVDTTWKSFFKRKYFQDDCYVSSMREALQNYESHKTRKTFSEFISVVERAKQASELKSFFPQSFPLADFQFIVDSVLYSKFEVATTKKYEITPGYQESYVNVVQGTLFNLKEESLSFSFQCNWTVHGFEMDDWDDGNHIEIGNAIILIPRDSDSDSENTEAYEEWLNGVQEQLGMDTTLKGVWKLVKTIIIPSYIINDHYIFEFL